MKTSLSHLPADKQDQIMQIVAIIKEVAAPEKIILYGSYAKGSYKEHEYFGKDGIRYQFYSDYDFLVVVEKLGVKHYEIEGQIEDKGKSRKIPVNVELHEIGYINEGLEFGQYFFTDIINTGVLLYDSEKFHFKDTHVLNSSQQIIISKNYFELWFTRGEGFLKVASYCLNEGEYKVGLFNLHQAAESYYSTALLIHNGYKPKSHNLWKLRKRTKGFSEELFLVFESETNKSENHLFDLLKRGYIDSRYKPDFEISKKELESLIEKVKLMRDIVQKISLEKINSLG